MTRKDIYSKYGIEYNPKTNKLLHPILGWINPVMIDGNDKIGKGVYHFSTLPGTMIYTVKINGRSFDIKGTCACNCSGCYAMTGRYKMPSNKNALGMRTWLARYDVEFLYNAICAQIEAEHIEAVRVHASGDFVSREYLEIWVRIVAAHPSIRFWTYTKIAEYERAFDIFEHANIVKSAIPGRGYNFGHCGYILDTVEALTRNGEAVHVCRCGVDNNQHCTNCKACSIYKYVLFIEHSTEYKAEADPLFPVLRDLIEAQPKA